MYILSKSYVTKKYLKREQRGPFHVMFSSVTHFIHSNSRHIFHQEFLYVTTIDFKIVYFGRKFNSDYYDMQHLWFEAKMLNVKLIKVRDI